MLTVRLCLDLGPNYLTRIDHHGEQQEQGNKTKNVPKKFVSLYRAVYISVLLRIEWAHFWIGEQQPRFYQTLYSPVPLFRILDVNSFPILSPGHFKIMGKKKKCYKWCHVCTSDYILHKKVCNVFLLPMFKADEQKWLYILAQF